MKPNYKKNWLKGPIKPMEPICLNNDRIINDEIGNKQYIDKKIYRNYSKDKTMA